MDSLLPYVAALVPTIVVAAFFYAIIKRMIEGDRRERLAQRRFEKDEDGQGNAGDNEPETPPSDD